MNAAKTTYTIETRTPNGRWFVASRRVSAVEADAIRAKNDPDVRIVPERSDAHVGGERHGAD